MRTVRSAWRGAVGLCRRPGLRRALSDAGVEIDRAQVRLVRVRPGSGWHRIADLAGYGLTPGLVGTAGHWRWDGGTQANVCALARLVAAGQDPHDLRACMNAGCSPLALEGAFDWAWPGTVLARPGAAPGQVGAALAASAGFLAGRRAGAWSAAAAVAARLLAEQVDPTPGRVLAWLAAGADPGGAPGPGPRELMTAWFAARPEQADPTVWADRTVRWAACGISPEEGRRLSALPAGHPDLPTAQDLAVMAALNSGQA